MGKVVGTGLDWERVELARIMIIIVVVGRGVVTNRASKGTGHLDVVVGCVGDGRASEVVG